MAPLFVSGVIFIASVTVKKIRLMVIALSLGAAGWVHAGNPPIQIESPSVARQVAVDDAGGSSYVKAGSFSSNSGKSLARDLNFTSVSVPYCLVSGRVSHVPEPEGWAMMLMGAGFVFYQVRRRKRARKAWDLRK